MRKNIKYKKPIWQLQRRGWVVQVGWDGTDIDVGTILGISENAYRHTQPKKLGRLLFFALFEPKNYRHDNIKRFAILSYMDILWHMEWGLPFERKF